MVKAGSSPERTERQAVNTSLDVIKASITWGKLGGPYETPSGLDDPAEAPPGRPAETPSGIDDPAEAPPARPAEAPPARPAASPADPAAERNIAD